MSRTVKQEWSKPDGWHLTKRLERKARPAGRIKLLAEQDVIDCGWYRVHADTVGPIFFEPVPAELIAEEDDRR